ncbi:DNA polymerase III subunit gamma/tau [Brevifollis gellanilyticus]|uniref:DNA polymerase III subunit gamma/tau n=1 Tax=Brevifollis gellanilyticus TaxID=748831 RepID=A0A512M7X8_9BACT|nr:DNA polymerase III subunit gamma/tau [Brevifollis gellanilyticus]GEP42842.1 DNA polymerase III subunit gamma/tau [Brevifollis gellanilyticus]
MSYQVFARKYRPKTFADVLGQEHVVRTLRNAIAQNRLAHAYLFVGPRGTGKTSTARIFAKALNCPNGPSIEFDPEDPICKEIAEGNSLDVLEIDGASNNGVDQVRDLRESVKYAPSRCRYKIYYIDEVHMLSTAAFNALLKTLEEPPPHVKFIFATTEANKILPTIISRCQRFDLRRIPLNIIAKHLLHIANEEGVDLDEKAAFAIGKGADGGMRDAQSMLDQLVAFCGNKIREEDVLEIFGFTSMQTVVGMVQHLLESDTVGALQLVHDTSEAGKDLGKLLSDLIQHIRTLLVSQADPEAGAEDLEPEIADRVAAQCQMATTEQLLRVVDGLAEVDARMRWATNKRLHLELGVIQAVQHLNEVSLSDVIEALESGTTGGLPKVTPRAAQVTSARAATPAAERVSVAPARVAEPAPAAPPVREITPPTAPLPVSREPERVIEPAPAPVVVKESVEAPAPVVKPTPVEASAPPIVSAAPERTPPPPAATMDIDLGQFWADFTNIIQERRALIVGWLRIGTLLSISHGVVKIGFPITEGHARESLNRDNQRKFLEAVAAEMLGMAVKFEMVPDASLAAPMASEMGFDLLDVPEPKPAAAPEARVDAPKAAGSAAPATASAPEAPAAPPEEFQNDPLIKAAVEKFKLKLAARA